MRQQKTYDENKVAIILISVQHISFLCLIITGAGAMLIDPTDEIIYIQRMLKNDIEPLSKF